MIKEKLTIINSLGLHARAAAKFVNLTSKYLSKIKIHIDNKIVNGKSIMGIMMLAATKNTIFEVVIDGEDEKELLIALKELINNKFGEKN